MIYLIVLIILFIPFVKYDLLAKQGYEGVWHYVCLISLILLAALRYRVGGDTLIYMDIFEYYPKISELSTFDFKNAEYNPMWYIYNSVFKSLGNSFFLFQLSQAIIINTIFFRFFYKYTNYFFTALIFYYIGYYCYYNFEIQREILCICIFLISYPFLEKGKYLRYYLLVIFASSIHYSALVLLIVPLFLLLKRDRFWLSLIIITIISYLFLRFDIISLAISFFFDSGAEKIYNYLRREVPNFHGIIVQFLIMLPYLTLFYVRYKYKIDDDKKMGAIVTIIIGIQCSSLFVPAVPRLSNYFFPIGIVFIINSIINNIDRIRMKQVSSVLVFGVLFVFFFNAGFYYMKSKAKVLPGAHEYGLFIPYVSVFNPHMVYERERRIINERTELDYEIFK